MEIILTLQSYLQASETSIDHILAMIIALVVLMIVGYLVECNNSEKGV